MTEERIKELLVKRYKSEALAPAILLIVVGIVIHILGSGVYAFVCYVLGLFFWIVVSCRDHDDVKNVDKNSLFLMYSDKNTLIRVMDEVLEHPVYKINGTNISEHFILYGDQYENIIRLCDVTRINKTKLNDVNSRIDIEDRFGQKKKVKIENTRVDDVYNYLKENCIKAEVDSVINFDDGVDRTIKFYIKHDALLTDEYCFGESISKKNKSTKKNKEDIVENKESNKKEEIEKESIEEKEKPKKSSDMDQKYNDLKKLKELLDNDIITKEDYDKEKAKILSD